MKRRKKIKLSYSKERVLFSDVLPYECPIIFSNRFYYRFLAKYLWVGSAENKEIALSQTKHTDDKDAYAFASLLFGCYEKGQPISTNPKQCNKALFYPFLFNIAHKANKNRTLSVIHPFCQWRVVNFYDKYKYSILYLCNQSSFSLRKPHKIAQYFYYRDRLHRKLSGHENDRVELFFNEYENLKTYFSYEKYSNIYKFYEDYRYQRAEKKYQHLLKFDIQSCFDSIYTHSISWATANGVEKVKILPKYHGSWVGDAFDDLMQSVNARETNGIVIGPEFSRIFAEIILQYVDRRVELELGSDKLKSPIHHKSEYECYRYVDDYFLFYNDEKDKDIFMEIMERWLKEFKLNISPSKTEKFERPFITKVTIAKQKIDDLLDGIFSMQLWDDPDSEDYEAEDENEEGNATGVSMEILYSKCNIYLSANKVNAQIKAIIKDCEVEYRDVANYLLEKMSQRLDIFLNRYENVFKRYERLIITENGREDDIKKHTSKAQNQLINFLLSYIDVAFFVFNSNRQVNTTLKIQRIMNSIVLYAKRHGNFSRSNPDVRFRTIEKDIIFKKIQDEIALVLATTDKHRNTLHESLYLLILAKELGNAYLFSHKVIEDFLRKSELQYNLFACIILMYYYSNHACYDELKQKLGEEIINKYRKVHEGERKHNTELTILTADMMTCPFVKKDFKMQLLTLMGITNAKDQEKIIRFAQKKRYIFTRWTMFNLNKELQAKISQEAYS